MPYILLSTGCLQGCRPDELPPGVLAQLGQVCLESGMLVQVGVLPGPGLGSLLARDNCIHSCCCAFASEDRQSRNLL